MKRVKRLFACLLALTMMLGLSATAFATETAEKVQTPANGGTVTFEKEYLRDLYEKGISPDKKHRFQPEIIKNYIRRIKTLEEADEIEDLFSINSLNYEILTGDKQGISSIRVNNQYRIEFTVTHQESEPVITVCNILELSNHYK